MKDRLAEVRAEDRCELSCNYCCHSLPDLLELVTQQQTTADMWESAFRKSQEQVRELEGQVRTFQDIVWSIRPEWKKEPPISIVVWYKEV